MHIRLNTYAMFGNRESSLSFRKSWWGIVLIGTVKCCSFSSCDSLLNGDDSEPGSTSEKWKSVILVANESRKCGGFRTQSRWFYFDWYLTMWLQTHRSNPHRVWFYKLTWKNSTKEVHIRTKNDYYKRLGISWKSDFSQIKMRIIFIMFIVYSRRWAGQNFR